MNDTEIIVRIDTSDLACQLAEGLADDALLRLVLDIDAYVADLEFTKSIHASLAKVIEEDEESE